MLLALALMLWPLAALAEAGDFIPDEGRLFLNTRADYADVGAPIEYHFTPARAANYLFLSLPGEGDMGEIAAVLSGDAGEILAESYEMGAFRLEAALQEGESVTLTVSGGGEGLIHVEVMENVYGRCAEQPTQLGDITHYTRALVEPRDTHWYAFTPRRSGFYTIRSVTEGAPDLRAYLFDRNLTEMAFSDDVLFPQCVDFRFFVELSANRTYYLRVSADSNQTGSYQLLIQTANEPRLVPRRVSFTPDRITLDPGQTFPARATAEPQSALHAITYISESPEVCAVDQEGILTAVGAGTAVIRGVCARSEFTLTVSVNAVPPSALSLDEAEITIPEEGTRALSARFSPENATETALQYASSDPAVADVDEEGVIAGVSAGECVVTALSPFGLTASVKVTVTPRAPVLRALVVGEQNYEDGRVRLGGLNTAQGVSDALRAQAAAGFDYTVTMGMDLTREALLKAVQAAFEGAREGDLAIVYINCHGDYDGVAYIELRDGTRLTADQLYAILEKIPGRVMVIVDCCRSGAFLGAGAGDAFARAMSDAFSASGGSPLMQGKFIVMTSASAWEDSYRRSFTAETEEASMATILARAMCEGLGWDLIGDRTCTLKADADKDRIVTAQELWAYTRKRVMYYLAGAGVTQTALFWPEGDQTPLGGRR